MSGKSNGGDDVFRRGAEHFRLIPRSTVLLEKLTVANLVKSPPSIESEVSAPCPQEGTTGLCLEPKYVWFTPSHHISLTFILTLSSHLHLSLQSGLPK
jgi:hypothetical protein